MRYKQARFLLILLLGIVLSGCLEISTTITVNPDGSGTITEKMIIDRSLTDMALGSTTPGKLTVNEFGLFTKAELVSRAALFGQGITFLSAKPLNEEKLTGYTAVYAFKNLQDVQIGINPEQNFNAKSLEMFAQAATRKKPAPFTFTFAGGNPAKIGVNIPLNNFADSLPEIRNPALDAASESTFNQDFIKQLAKMFSLKINVTLVPNGAIVSTDAPYRKGGKISLFALDFGELMQDKTSLKAISKTPPRTLSEAKKTMKNMKGFQVPEAETISIQFKKK
jgi:hypothetical protein